MLTVAVQDEAGRPVPFARVTLTCADGNSLSLATVADGTAVFFPGLDRLGRSVRLSVAGGGRGRTVAHRRRRRARSGTASPCAPARSPVRKFDLLLAIDTTGSMGDEIAYLKSELRTILADLRRSHPGLDIRLGLVAYQGRGRRLRHPHLSVRRPTRRRCRPICRPNMPTAAATIPRRWTSLSPAPSPRTGGPDAVKSLLLVADAPPHDENIGKAWRAAEAARAKRIQIVPVAASGVGDTAEYVMRAMAAATQSRYIFLTDDSGIGNPHATAGVDCFLVTRLDRLVRRVLDSPRPGSRRSLAVEPLRGRRSALALARVERTRSRDGPRQPDVTRRRLARGGRRSGRRGGRRGRRCARSRRLRAAAGLRVARARRGTPAAARRRNDAAIRLPGRDRLRKLRGSPIRALEMARLLEVARRSPGEALGRSTPSASSRLTVSPGGMR